MSAIKDLQVPFEFPFQTSTLLELPNLPNDVGMIASTYLNGIALLSLYRVNKKNYKNVEIIVDFFKKTFSAQILRDLDLLGTKSFKLMSLQFMQGSDNVRQSIKLTEKNKIYIWVDKERFTFIFRCNPTSKFVSEYFQQYGYGGEENSRIPLLCYAWTNNFGARGIGNILAGKNLFNGQSNFLSCKRFPEGSCFTQHELEFTQMLRSIINSKAKIKVSKEEETKEKDATKMSIDITSDKK